jgi:hypothetical protein
MKMRSIPAAVALLMLALTISSTVAALMKSSASKMAQGDVRCEGAGAVVINIDGADMLSTGWQVVVIHRYNKCGTRPLILKPTSTVLSWWASRFAIGRMPPV